MRMLISLLVVSVTVTLSSAQILGSFACPQPWLSHLDRCYKFEQYPTAISDAEQSCASDGASLVSVNSQEEHNFIADWLSANDGLGRHWFTSGRKTTVDDGMEFRWDGDGIKVSGVQFWLDDLESRVGPGDRILYHTDGRIWGWRVGESFVDRPFICEISKSEIYKISQEARGFDYGLEEIDSSEWKMGPKFYIQPEEIVYDVDSTLQSVSMECAASANPLPTYMWYKNQAGVLVEVAVLSDSRFTMLNGKLIINAPEETRDNAAYQCIARNPFGAVLSNTAQLRFGYLPDFPKSNREPLSVTAYTGYGIPCDPPDNGYDSISYAWYKDNIHNFVRPDKKSYMFISNDGSLYFESVTKDDAGDYYCLITRPRAHMTVQGGKQSMPIRLNVVEGLASEQEPGIVNSFPKVFPNGPKVGDNLRIECLAYATPPIQYSWRKENGALPAGSYLSDHNRVLNIPNVQLMHGGSYRCTARRQDGLTDYKLVAVTISAAPFFTIPLSDQHMDADQTLTWRCIGDGIPTVTYQWYINATRIEDAFDAMNPTDRQQFELQNNVLTIQQVKPQFAGMYQCSVSNRYGAHFSSAQLRVLALAPTFRKFPIQPNQYGTLGGNMTISCLPEAAPYPTEKTWYKNGRPLSTSDSRVVILPNGNLRITRLLQSDEGTYKCSVENSLGTAESSGNLTILPTTTITNPPRNLVKIVNETSFFECEASYDPTIDLSYEWWHNNYKIEFIKLKNLGNTVYIYREPYFERGTGIHRGGLFIRHTQFQHAGEYTCIVMSSSYQIVRQATLTVIGPPSPPAGVQKATEGNTTHDSIMLAWWPGSDHGRTIQSYTVQSMNKFENFWTIKKRNIPHVTGANVKIHAKIEGLAPFSSYRFRVQARNNLGLGEPSEPSISYTTEADVPRVAPKNVGGGGGKVGDLTITWDALPPEQHNGPDLSYRIRWKQSYMVEDEWEERTIRAEDALTDNLFPGRLRFVHLVQSTNFYKPYHVDVAASNIKGDGPVSDTVTIMSAEDIPKATPTNVQAVYYNSTAILVEWNPVQNTREEMKGVLIGYRINYWIVDEEDESMAQFRFVPGQRSSGIIIGLYPNTYYQVNVQAINSAGNGPKSERYKTRTLRAAPKEAPQEVNVFTVDDHTILVEWRGVSTTIEEEPLEGYMVRYFTRGENIYVATDVDAGKASRKVLTGLAHDVMYELRVFGYSRGGDGLQSSPTIEFILGAGCTALEDSPDKEYIYDCRNGASYTTVSWALIILSLLYIGLKTEL